VKSHRHEWRYPHQIIEGRTKHEVAVWRYCADCGLKELAYASAWRKPPKRYELEVSA